MGWMVWVIWLGGRLRGGGRAWWCWRWCRLRRGSRLLVSGVLNSWMVWRQAPQGWLAVSLRLATAMARMRMVGPWRLTAVAMAVCSAQVVRR